MIRTLIFASVMLVSMCGCTETSKEVGTSGKSKYLAETSANIEIFYNTYAGLPDTPNIMIPQKINDLEKISSDQTRLETESVPDIQNMVKAKMRGLISTARMYEIQFNANDDNRAERALNTWSNGIKVYAFQDVNNLIGEEKFKLNQR